MHRSETLSKLVPLRSKTDHANHDERQPRVPSRTPLPAIKASSKSRGTHYRRVAKDTVQSAFELRPPITFEHLLRRDRKSPNHSRRNSNENAKERGLELARAQSHLLRKHVGIADVNRIVEQNQRREAELRQALQQVEEQGRQYTRELDETYYALLERGEALRQIVRGLQGLADEGRSLRSQFDSDAADLERSTTHDTDSYQNFGEQEQAIRAMLAKLEKSKERSISLNSRLDAAHSRVEASEQRVLHAQRQRRRRWRVIWILTGTILVVLLGFWIARKNAELDARINFGDILPSTKSIGKGITKSPKQSPTEDAYLRDLFEGIS